MPWLRCGRPSGCRLSRERRCIPRQPSGRSWKSGLLTSSTLMWQIAGASWNSKRLPPWRSPTWWSSRPTTTTARPSALAATLQVAATMPNFLITEYFVNFTESGNAISVKPLRVEGGYIRIPDEPGLGLEIDESALKQYPYRKPSPRKFRSYGEEGP